MPVVSRPPVLGVGHQLPKVFLQRIVVYLRECLGIVEPLVCWLECRRVLMKDSQVQLVWPPVPDHVSTQCGVFVSIPCYRTGSLVFGSSHN